MEEITKYGAPKKVKLEPSEDVKLEPYKEAKMEPLEVDMLTEIGEKQEITSGYDYEFFGGNNKTEYGATTQQQVKHESFEELSDIKTEIKTGDEFFEDNENTDLLASASQIKFEDIDFKDELQLDSEWEEDQYMNSPPMLDGVSKLTEPCEVETKKKNLLEKAAMSGNSQQIFKPFMCSYCNSAFNLSSIISKNNKYHKVIKSLKCSNCNYEITPKESYFMHKITFYDGTSYRQKQVLTLSRVKPFVCHSCDLSFSMQNHISEHFKSIHNTLKSFKCLCCDYVCSENITLHNHIITVHLELRFKCSACNYPGSSKGELARHIKSIHKKSKIGI